MQRCEVFLQRRGLVVMGTPGLLETAKVKGRFQSPLTPRPASLPHFKKATRRARLARWAAARR